MLSSAFSHLMLAGTGVYCLVSYPGCSKKFNLPCMALKLIVTNSMIGMWRWGIPENGEKLDKVYKLTGLFQNIVTLPFMVTEAWLIYGYQKELAYLHSLTAVIPFTLYLADKPHDDLIDLIVALNFESLMIVSCMNENYYGVLAALCYIFSRAAVANNRQEIEEIPSRDVSNFLLCIFCYFIMRSFSYTRCAC
ncbi:hypothetical protein ILUMI_06418 [Ignelater luminosus]|uniref:Transmembrane protein 147 n=1 Tax=Ignelater luminosus TaxID=2038154 RepID=A0A8K0D8H2_IGNLU|nr:hypothetical protein ILUMI_06418 [Ignelater luminosus]